ncbi:MAG: alkaline phosphatase family protein [Polyangiaceae bacterium]
MRKRLVGSMWLLALGAVAGCGSSGSSGAGGNEAGGVDATGAGSSGSATSSEGSSGTGASSSSSSGSGDDGGSDATTGSSGGSSSGGSSSGGTDAGVTKDSGGADSGTASVIKKVFYVMEENRDSNQIYGASDAPYVNGTLMATYEYASDYTNVAHPSEPNYVWLEAGNNNCGDHTFTTDNDPSNSNSTTTTDHLVNYLGRVGKTWKSYQENLTASCGITSSGNYAAKHNPFVFFKDVVGSYTTPTASCTSHIVDYSNLATDLANDTLADFVEITPNLCDDGHDCNNATVETFLQSTTMQSIISYVATAKNHAILIIDWDESESTSLLPMLVVGPTSTLSAVHDVTTNVNHSSFVRSMQMIFGVDPGHTDPTTGRAFGWLRNASGASDLSSFFGANQFP